MAEEMPRATTQTNTSGEFGAQIKPTRCQPTASKTKITQLHWQAGKLQSDTKLQPACDELSWAGWPNYRQLWLCRPRRPKLFATTWCQAAAKTSQCGTDTVGSDQLREHTSSHKEAATYAVFCKTRSIQPVSLSWHPCGHPLRERGQRKDMRGAQSGTGKTNKPKVGRTGGMGDRTGSK
jgi:hypothetical protein